MARWERGCARTVLHPISIVKAESLKNFFSKKKDKVPKEKEHSFESKHIIKFEKFDRIQKKNAIEMDSFFKETKFGFRFGKKIYLFHHKELIRINFFSKEIIIEMLDIPMVMT